MKVRSKKYGIAKLGRHTAALLLGAGTVLGVAGAGHAASTNSGGQASITLSGSDVALCNHNNTSWELSKEVTGVPTLEAPAVTWTVTATKVAVSHTILEVNGFVAVTNTGSAPAPVGNIVINLQRQRGNKWVSASADVVTAYAGDAAKSANILASQSAETTTLNAQWNSPATYTVSGAAGTFKENAASGSVEFTDADFNTAFSLQPGYTIPVGATVNLLYQAEFDNTVLNIPAGESVRAEVIVSFANAGGRGGSGATGSNIDVNGNGAIDANEANVRSVPTRITKAVPAVEACNSTVTLSDLGVESEGTVTGDAIDYQGWDLGYAISNTTQFSIVASNVSGGTDGGSLCNTAKLQGQSTSVSVIIGYTTQTITNPDLTTSTVQVPVYRAFECCPAADLSATACQAIEKVVEQKGICTYSKGGLANGVASAELAANFGTLCPGGLTIGIADGVGPRHNATWTNVAALQTWLNGGGPSATLTADTLNATSTSGGTLAKQTAALALNIAFSPAFANLVLTGTGTSLDGSSVAQILAAANNALGGAGFPSGYNAGSLNTLVNNLNLSYDTSDCSETTWGITHLL